MNVKQLQMCLNWNLDTALISLFWEEMEVGFCFTLTTKAKTLNTLTCDGLGVLCVCVFHQAYEPEVKRTRGDVPDILPEPEAEPTSPVSDFENSYNYVCTLF